MNGQVRESVRTLVLCLSKSIPTPRPCWCGSPPSSVLGLARAHFDSRYNLTPDEFRVEGEMIAIGPLYDEEALGTLTSELETLGLVYFEDFAEMSGNWPPWLTIFARGV